eukprot:2580447-Amphidinium_carterae.1
MHSAITVLAADGAARMAARSPVRRASVRELTACAAMCRRQVLVPGWSPKQALKEGKTTCPKCRRVPKHF